MRLCSGRTITRSEATTSPATSTQPASGRSKPAMRRSSVVLPQRDGPSRHSTSPRATSRSRQSTAAGAWGEKRLVRPLTRTIGSAGNMAPAALSPAGGAPPRLPGPASSPRERCVGARTARGASVGDMPQRLTLPLAAAAALLAPAAVLAQTTVASLLPETTVLALHLSPEGVDTSTLGSLVDDLDLERAAASARSLAALFEEAVGGELHDAELPVDPLEELAVTCPDLAAALEAAADSFGPTVLGVSLSRFDPVPDVVAVTRPEEHDVASRLAAAAADGLDGTSLGREGDAELYLLADGAELPFVVAESDGFLVASTDPELARGALRRAQGSREPGFADTRLGALSTSLTARGLGATLNLAAAADAVELYRGILGEAPEAGPLLDRFVTTLRALGGFAWHVSVDAGGLVVESVSAFDSRLAAEAGEDELLALLACRGCELSGPELLPRDAVGLRGGVFSASALVAWVDSWLADAREAGLVGDAAPGSLEGLLGVDLGDLLLDWVGVSWSAAWLDVLATDARPWLQGLPAVVTVPVTSEDEARRGVELWLDTLASLAAAGEEIVVEAGA